MLITIEVERMVAEAEKFKVEDEANASRIHAKNTLETYCYSMKNTLADEKLSDNAKDLLKDIEYNYIKNVLLKIKQRNYFYLCKNPQSK